VRFQGEYLNLYSEYDGHTWHTALARSADGVHWDKRGRVLSPSGWEGTAMAENGSAMVAGDQILYWYEAGDPFRIALARSKDGVSWSKLGAPVLDVGPLGSFDESGVADPYVTQIAGEFYLFYLGQDRARRQRLGVARSSDGVHWEKLRSNPILELGAAGAFDENGLGEPAVWSSGGSYWMLYTGRDRGERRRIGLARSNDGVHWNREMGFKPIAGDQPWNREVMCDPSVLVEGNEVRVWFGGGDVPRPDQGLHGQIGLGFLK
jgi:sucrose-6-phosphate hydrolase SacC (GH32 family)